MGVTSKLITAMKGEMDYSQACCLIMGGGTCLTQDLYKAPKGGGVVTMQINHHCNILHPDFSVAEDKVMYPLIRDCHTTRVMGRFPNADIDVNLAPSWGNSGMTALWIADYLGFGMIVLAGFDCWDNENRYYWHDPTFVLPQSTFQDYEQTMLVWKEVKGELERPEKVYSISKNLQEVFSAYTNEGT
jgi:hypothetical protein